MKLNYIITLILFLVIMGCVTDQCPPSVVDLPTNELRQRAFEICNTEEKIATNLYGVVNNSL